MSFFDDEGNEPRRAPGARAAGRTGFTPRRGRARSGDLDPRTVRTRQLVGLAGLVVFIVLLALVVKSCRDSAQRRGLERYDRHVVALARESDTQVGQPLLALLSGGGASPRSPLDVRSGVNQVRVTAERQLSRARGLDTPDPMTQAQRNLRLAFELRAQAVRTIADQVPVALGKSGADQAIGRITDEMQVLLGSDVIFSRRVTPLVGQTLRRHGIRGMELPQSRFIAAPLDWLNPATVGQRLAGVGGAPPTTQPAPGLHGHGLSSASIGGVTLLPGTPVTIPAGTPPTLTVRFQNQGTNDERNVAVRATLGAPGAQSVTAQQIVALTKAGQPASAQLTFNPAPPTGTPLTLTVEIATVPGEGKTTNNKGTYSVLFSP